jgi:uncharacterized membrane protein YdbT with pleckstrin-like domain
MRLILNRPVKVAGVRLATGADVTDLSKDYRASIEHQGWANWQEVKPEPQPEVKEETKPVEQVAKPVQRPQRKPKK